MVERVSSSSRCNRQIDVSVNSALPCSCRCTWTRLPQNETDRLPTDAAGAALIGRCGQVIFDELAAKCGKDFHGSLCIKLWESHKAWGCYEGDVGEEEGEA